MIDQLNTDYCGNFVDFEENEKNRKMNRSAELFFIDGCGRCSLGGTPQCKVNLWNEELQILREIILSTNLKEECKWGMPCYTYKNKNVLILCAFKQYCGIGFFKGSLIHDTEKILTTAGENANASRIIKVTKQTAILDMSDAIVDLIEKAIEIEKGGLKIEPKLVSDLNIPEELKSEFEQDPEYKIAFYKLSPGKQKGYLYFFNGAKQSKTRQSRILSSKSKVFLGKGIHDY